MSIDLKQIFLLSSILFASWGCHEKLDLDVCRPGDPACGDEDFDGDGVVNRQDDFPIDVSCSKQDEMNCGGCGQSCGEGEACEGDGCEGGGEACEGWRNNRLGLGSAEGRGQG